MVVRSSSYGLFLLEPEMLLDEFSNPEFSNPGGGTDTILQDKSYYKIEIKHKLQNEDKA